MNMIHLHLMLNHIPVVGIPITIFILLAGLYMKERSVINVGLVLAVIIALASIPVYLTGEEAEKAAEKLPGVSEALIEEHEEVAKPAFVLMLVSGGLALASIATGRVRRDLLPKAVVAAVVGLLISGGLMAWTANLGGKIRHPEIRGEGAVYQGEVAPYEEKD